MPRAWTVTDLHFGDSGKGTITEALVRRHGARLVVRSSGGCQCAHNVITNSGLHHTFSQFGSGTLAGASTLLTQHVLVDPLRLMREREVLLSKGVTPFVVQIHEDALITTPFHAAFNRLKERARGEGRHGSCGVGIGETARYALEQRQTGGWKDTVPTIGVLDCPEALRYALTHLREHLVKQIVTWDFIPRGGEEDFDLFKNDYVIDALIRRYQEAEESCICVIGHEQMLHAISSQDTVWEGAQGVLLDEDYGFHPHTTWSRVTLRNATETLAEAGVTDVTNVGVLRAYGHRHGPGPFPTEDESIRPSVMEPHNGVNEWQNSFRVGWFDMLLARYALKVAGGTDKAIHWQKCPIHELAITHADRLLSRQSWPIIMGYGINLSEVPAADDWSKRERLTSSLMGVDSGDWLRDSVKSDEVPAFIAHQLDLPLSIVSSGPTYQDKTFLRPTLASARPDTRSTREKDESTMSNAY